MAMHRRPSGVLIEARGDAEVPTGTVRIRRARLGELAPPSPAAAGRRRGPATAAAPQAALTEEEAVVNALEAQDLVLLDAIPIEASSSPKNAPAAAARRGGHAAP